MGGFKKGGFKAYKEFNKDKLEDTEESTVKLVPPEISYNRDELMNIAKMPLSQATPEAWPSIAKKLPRLVRREGAEVGDIELGDTGDMDIIPIESTISTMG